MKKKRVDQIDPLRLSEPALTDQEWELLRRGAVLFNEKRFWDAHEVWEQVWRGRREESRIFFQGIIQAAAGYHLLVERPRYRGASKNLEKALTKLRIFPDLFLGIDVKQLRDSILTTQEILAHRGPDDEIQAGIIPKLSLNRSESIGRQE